MMSAPLLPSVMFHVYNIHASVTQLSLVEQPVDLTVKEGESACFACRVSPHSMSPPPTVTWFFMGKPIASDNIYTVQQSEDGQCRLLLPEAFPEDAGIYTVRAADVSGMVEASAILTVDGECLCSHDYQVRIPSKQILLSASPFRGSMSIWFPSVMKYIVHGSKNKN